MKETSEAFMTDALLGRVKTVLSKIDSRSYSQFTKNIISADKIFVVGTGRSGLVGKFLCMRLVHIGKAAYTVGETTTPRIEEGNLLVALTASGNTVIVNNCVSVAKESKARVNLITSNPSSDIYDLADCVVRLERRLDLNGRMKYEKVLRDREREEKVNVMPMGTMFELSSLMFLESVVGQIILDLNIQENEMKMRHTNLE